MTSLSLAIDLHDRFTRTAERYEALGLHVAAVMPRQLAQWCGDYPQLYVHFCAELEAHVAEKEAMQ